MTTAVSVNTYAHTVTHVTDKMLYSIQEITRLIGLDPGQLSRNRHILEVGISAWLASQHLRLVTLEVYSAQTDKLVTRWDIEVVYGYTGDGSLWADPDTFRYAIQKAGLAPAGCRYRVIVDTKPGAPEVSGWSSTSYRSTGSLRCYHIGSNIGGNGIATETAYWAR